MKKSVHLDMKLSEDLLRKLLYVSQAEKRSPDAQIAFMIRNNVAYYEKTKGRINPADLAKIDISEYEEKED